MYSSSVEEAMEWLYLSEIENDSRTAEPETIAALEECVALGLARSDAEKHRLTDKGRETGRDVLRRHRLAECLLKDVLQEGHEHLHEDSCRFEHLLQHGLDDRVCALLGHPGVCPHGKAIPPGECCLKARADQIREVAPLCDGKPGADGTVVYLATRDNREIQKMMAMGILPGAPIRLLQRFPSYVFQVGYSQFAVDRPLAKIIYVHWTTRT